MCSCQIAPMLMWPAGYKANWMCLCLFFLLLCTKNLCTIFLYFVNWMPLSTWQQKILLSECLESRSVRAHVLCSVWCMWNSIPYKCCECSLVGVESYTFNLNWLRSMWLLRKDHAPSGSLFSCMEYKLRQIWCAHDNMHCSEYNANQIIIFSALFIAYIWYLYGTSCHCLQGMLMRWITTLLEYIAWTNYNGHWWDIGIPHDDTHCADQRTAWLALSLWSNHHAKSVTRSINVAFHIAVSPMLSSDILMYWVLILWTTGRKHPPWSITPLALARDPQRPVCTNITPQCRSSWNANTFEQATYAYRYAVSIPTFWGTANNVHSLLIDAYHKQSPPCTPH